MPSIEQHLARIKEEENVAEENNVLLREKRDLEYPEIARLVDTRLSVLRQLGVIPLIEAFTNEPVEPLSRLEVPQLRRVPEFKTPAGVLMSMQDLNGAYREFLRKEEEKSKLWHAYVLKPQLRRDLSWNTNVNIELVRQEMHKGEVFPSVVDLVFYHGNVLEIKAAKGQIFSRYLQAMSPDNLVLSDDKLDQVSAAIAKAINDPIKPASVPNYYHFPPVIGQNLA